MRLEPAASISGRLVGDDERGVPLALVNCKLADDNGEIRGDYFRVTTGDDGRFRIEGLVPALKYTIRTLYRRGDRYVLASRELPIPAATFQLKPGEAFDLGDVHMADDVVLSAATKRIAANDEPAEKRAVVAGRVTLPGGEPAAGAHGARWLPTHRTAAWRRPSRSGEVSGRSHGGRSGQLPAERAGRQS